MRYLGTQHEKHIYVKNVSNSITEMYKLVIYIKANIWQWIPVKKDIQSTCKIGSI